MRVREVIVTRESNVKDIEALSRHPNVRKCWRLPRAYVIFEFYHPVFERVYDSDISVKHAALAEDAIRIQSAAAMAEQRKILDPIYKGKRQSFLIPGRTAFTIFWSKGTIQWLEVKLYAGWETAKESVFAMKLVIVTDDTVRELRKVIQQWTESGIAQGEIEEVGPVTFCDREARVQCRFVGPTCTDAIMALYILLTDTRALTSVESLERVVSASPLA